MDGGYFPTGPFIGARKLDQAFEEKREDFLLNHSEDTARAYKADLQDWAVWCLQHKVDPTQPSRKMVADYAASLNDRGYAASTRKRRLSTLRRFLDHLRAQGGDSKTSSRIVVLPCGL